MTEMKYTELHGDRHFGDADLRAGAGLGGLAPAPRSHDKFTAQVRVERTECVWRAGPHLFALGQLRDVRSNSCDGAGEFVANDVRGADRRPGRVGAGACVEGIEVAVI